MKVENSLRIMKWYYDVKEVDRRISHFLVKPSSLVCDVGGGIGIDSFAFAELGAHVIDLDIDADILRNAKKFAKKNELKSRLSFIRASATKLPLKDGAVDLVTCFSVLDHLPNKKGAYEAITEFSRVTRKFGHIAITAPNKLFLIGTVSMKIKNLTQLDAFFEQRFTPSELWLALTSSKLTPIVFDSKYPTSVGPRMLEQNFPSLLKKIPKIMILLSLGSKIFNRIAKIYSLRLLGARIGYLSQKR